MIRNNNVYRYAPATDVWATLAACTGCEDYNMTESDERGHVFGHSASGEIIASAATARAGSGCRMKYISHVAAAGDRAAVQSSEPGPAVAHDLERQLMRHVSGFVSSIRIVDIAKSSGPIPMRVC